MLIQWPDRFYHTSFDTLDKVSPKMLHLSGSIAASFAYFVAVAGAREARWLAAELLAQSKAELLRLMGRRMEAVLAAEDERGVQKTAAKLAREGRFMAGGQGQALRGIQRLAPLEFGNEERELRQFSERELARAQELIGRETKAKLDGKIAKEPEEWEERAAGLVPVRRHRGPPAQIRPYLRKLPQEDRDVWFKLGKEFKGKSPILPTLALYWTDGRRNLAEVIDLVELESGARAGEQLVKHFELLEKMGLVELRE